MIQYCLKGKRATVSSSLLLPSVLWWVTRLGELCLTEKSRQDQTAQDAPESGAISRAWLTQLTQNGLKVKQTFMHSAEVTSRLQIRPIKTQIKFVPCSCVFRSKAVRQQLYSCTPVSQQNYLPLITTSEIWNNTVVLLSVYKRRKPVWSFTQRKPEWSFTQWIGRWH